MIVINQPKIVEKNNKYYIYCEIVDNNVQKQVFWGGVKKEYEKYLLYERNDAFLVGLLSYAMRTQQDIESKAPISEELLYNLNQYLIPLVTKYGNGLHKVKIYAQTDSSRLECGGYVGASASCGVDSFNTLHNQLHSEYPSMNITHLCMNDVGAYNECYGNEKEQRAIKEERYIKAEEMANEVGLPLIRTESNFAVEFPQNHLLTNTYSSMFSVLCMRKAWRTYYYSSAFHDIGLFSLFDNETKDTSYYDLLTLNCLSTDGIKIYSEGGERTRLEKVQSIVDFEPARKYLHVCIRKNSNCGICEKCRRTLLCIDIAGKLDEFKNVFDIDYYQAHKKDYYEWLYQQYVRNPLENMDMYQELKKISVLNRVEEDFQELKNDIQKYPVVLYGYGKRGKKLEECIYKNYGKKPEAVVDNSDISTHTITHSELKALKELQSKEVLCLISPEKEYEEIRKAVEKDFPAFKIVSRYHIDLLLQ